MSAHGAYLAQIHAAASVAHVPAGTHASVIAAILGCIVVLLVPCGILLFSAVVPLRPRSRDDEDPDSGWGRGGGGGPPSPSAPPQPESGPVWWPEFERQFAAHVEHARRTEPAVVTRRVDWP